MKKILCLIITAILSFSVSIIVSAEDSIQYDEKVNEIISNGMVVSATGCEIEIVYEKNMQNTFEIFSNSTSDNNIVNKEISTCKIITNSEEDTQRIYHNLSASPRASSGTQTKDFEGGLAILTSTICYSATDINNLTYMWITSATGSVTLLDSPTSVVDSLVTFGQIGLTETGLYVQQRDEQDKGAVFSWTAYPPSTFKKVLVVEMNDYTFVGCAYECTVRRGTADTTYTLSNSAFEMSGG